MLCDVKTTDKMKNDPPFRQFPMLVSKCKITDKNLSEHQLNHIKEKRGNKNTNYNSQSEKLLVNLGNNSNCYLNFEMYQMMKKAGYEISIKKILEFKHKAIFKNYLEFLYSKKKEYSLQNKKATELCFKILMNSFYGSTLTDKTRFRDIRICTTKRQALQFTKLPNFHSYKIINDKLIRGINNKKQQSGLSVNPNEILSQELHKPKRINFERRKITSNHIDHIWGIDLITMIKYAKQNNNDKHILTVVDFFSKYSWCYHLKNKIQMK